MDRNALELGNGIGVNRVCANTGIESLECAKHDGVEDSLVVTTEHRVMRESLHLSPNHSPG